MAIDLRSRLFEGFGKAQERATQKEEAIGIAKTPESGGYKEAARIKGIRIGNRMVAEKELRDFDNALNMAQKEYINHATHYSEIQNASARTRMNQNYNKIRDGIIRQGIEIDKKMAEEKLDADQKNFLIKQVKALGGQLAFGYYMKESKQMFDDFMTAKESQMVAKGAELGVPQEGPGGQTYQEYLQRTGQAPEPKAAPEPDLPGETLTDTLINRYEDDDYKAIQPTSLNDPIMDKVVTDPMERRLIEAQEQGWPQRQDQFQRTGVTQLERATGLSPEWQKKGLERLGEFGEEAAIMDPSLLYPEYGELQKGPILDKWKVTEEELERLRKLGVSSWDVPGAKYPAPGR